MTTFLTIIHVLACLMLIISILLQSSKGGGMAGMFGGGGGAAAGVFGGRGAAPFLAKVTMWLGITFGATSIVIALLSSNVGTGSQKSALQQVAEQEQASTPAAILPSAPGADEGEASPIQ